MQNSWFFVTAFFIGALFAEESLLKTVESPPTPWLTGPLIAPNGEVVSFGHIDFESYTYFTTVTGVYDKNWHSVSAPQNFFTINPQFFCYFGLTSWMDILVIPQFFYNHIGDQNGCNFGDLALGFDFQLLDSTATPYFPGIKFTIAEIFPTGTFQKLDPSKLLTDLTGDGAFGTLFSFVLYKLYPLNKRHFLSTTYSIFYRLNTAVDVQGLNAYGGWTDTKGTVLPGNNLQAAISFELTLTQNWVLALDNVFNYTGASEFFGATGTTPSGAPPPIAPPAATQISFAPAIEYNFSANFGIEVGAWITAWGKNAAEFRSAAININYVY